jgi:hypothetical protein
LRSLQPCSSNGELQHLYNISYSHSRKRRILGSIVARPFEPKPLNLLSIYS